MFESHEITADSYLSNIISKNNEDFVMERRSVTSPKDVRELLASPHPSFYKCYKPQ